MQILDSFDGAPRANKRGTCLSLEVIPLFTIVSFRASNFEPRKHAGLSDHRTRPGFVTIFPWLLKMAIEIVSVPIKNGDFP